MEKMPEHLVMSRSKKGQENSMEYLKIHQRQSRNISSLRRKPAKQCQYINMKTKKPNFPGWKVTESDMNVCET